MRVLTYVNGDLTVIRDDEFFSGISEKPTFINGDSFYYEPTLKVMDGRELSVKEVNDAETYITNFVFHDETLVPSVFCVNADGEYIGFKLIEDGEFQVPTKRMPDQPFVIWDFETEEWIESICVDKDTGLYLGKWFKEAFPNSIYVKSSSLLPMCISCQYYDFTLKTFVVDFDKAKSQKFTYMSVEMQKVLHTVIGNLGSNEASSWKLQEDEARAWNTDTSSLTPLIDALLVGRNMGETKEDLVVKIIAKADAYKVFYGQLLGKFHAKQKEVESASTIEELKAIVW